MTKLKNSNCDKTQKYKLWKKHKNSNREKLKNSNCEKKNLNTQLSPNSKTQIVTKHKETHYDKTQKMKL